MLRMRYVAVHGYIVMTMPTVIVCDCLSYSSLPYPFLHAHYAHEEGAGLTCHPCQPYAPFDKVLKPQLPYKAVDTQPFNSEEW